MSYHFKIFQFLGIACLLAACNSKPTAPDVSHIPLEEVKIKRLDKEMFSFDTTQYAAEEARFDSLYPNWFGLYTNNVLNLGEPGSFRFRYNVRGFLYDAQINQIRDSVTLLYEDVSELEQELQKAFRYARYYLPDFRAPKLVTYISGFNQKFAATDSVIGISLDQFLGTESYFYSKLQEPFFQRKAKNRYNLVPEIIRAYTMLHQPYQCEGTNVLAAMMSYGKLNYFLSKLLPDYFDDLIMGLSLQEAQYLHKYEKEIWEIVVERSLMFQKSSIEITQLTEPAPFTGLISRDVPERAMNWIGWQIVKAYVQQTEASLTQVMAEKDANKILQLSMYNP